MAAQVRDIDNAEDRRHCDEDAVVRCEWIGGECACLPAVVRLCVLVLS